MSFKEVTNGLPQTFLTLNSKVHFQYSCRLPSIFRATIHSNSQNTLTLLRNWILTIWLFFRSQKRLPASCQTVICWLNCQTDELLTQKYHVNIIFLIRNLFLLRNVIVSLIKQLIRYLPFLSVHTEKIFSLVLNDKTSENIFLVWTSKPLNNIY